MVILTRRSPPFMRVISMVPSWTETLLEAGLQVVGRTRFCIHPEPEVEAIPRVGGTKDWNWERILELKPDLLVLDQEENPKWMAEQTDIPYWASHIRGIESVAAALLDLSDRLKSQPLAALASRWERVDRLPALAEPRYAGVLEWGRRPLLPVKRVVYIIWRDPWMGIAPQTFIGSVLSRLGLPLPAFETAYPELDLATFPVENTLLLFSSEPYPFMRKREGIHELGFPYAFVDGESFSWFGVRSLRFLELSLDHKENT